MARLLLGNGIVARRLSLIALLLVAEVAAASAAPRGRPASPARSVTTPMAEKRSASPRLLLRLRPGRMTPVDVATARRPVRLATARSKEMAGAARASLARAGELIRGGEANPARRAEARRRALAEVARAELRLRRLVRAGQMHGKVYKGWVRAVSEARLVQMHAAVRLRHPGVDVARALGGSVTLAELDGMLADLFALSPPALEAALAEAADGLYGAAGAASGADLLRENPLVFVPLRQAATRTTAATRDTVEFAPGLLSSRHGLRGGRRRYQVRRDLAFVWVPGVARTYAEFAKQERTLLENGVLSLRAETGTFENPYRNAYDIAAQVVRARKVTGNPNVKVVLVGYSQGNNTIHAFLQSAGRNPRERAMFSELRKNIAFVHDINSAARGTPVADLGVILTKLLTGRSDEVPELDRQVNELERFLTSTGDRLQLRLVGWLRADPERLGRIDRLVKRLAGRRTDGRPTLRSRFADRVHDFLVGRLESLTSARGRELMSGPELAAATAALPVVATVGVVPPSRESELVPKRRPLDQTGGWKYLLDTGLANDYQVPEERQKLEPVLRSAVDLRTQANGHWGVVGVPVKFLGRSIHDESHYPRFSPELHALHVLDLAERIAPPGR